MISTQRTTAAEKPASERQRGCALASRGACVTKETPGAASGVSAAHAESFVFMPYLRGRTDEYPRHRRVWRTPGDYVPSRSVYASGATASSGARNVKASRSRCTAAAKSRDASLTLSPSAALK